MKRIAFISGIVFSDCDFPLIHSFIKKDLDVSYFIFSSDKVNCGGVLDLSNENLSYGLHKADGIPSFEQYKDYIDLNKTYVVYGKEGWSRKYFCNWYIALKVFITLLLLKPYVLHLSAPLSNQFKLLYLIGKRIVGIVHDPIRHSSFTSSKEENERILYFKKCDRLVLLNDVQTQQFKDTYHIEKSKIFYNRLGEYECLRICDTSRRLIKFPYILFFGQIQSHKGIEYLCEAMKMIHANHPDIHLVIAGRGEMYFDFEPYKHLDYFHLLNEFISIDKLANLLRYCEFSVCYYKDATQSGCVQTAFSANVPLIVSDVGALPKAVTDNVTGLVVPPCNSKMLADAMDRLLSDSNLLASMKDNIDKLWRPKMSWNSIADQYIRIYEG